MKIHFLGTGAAEGVPAEFCNCENCLRIKELGESEFRTRSQVIIDDVLSIDFPPEAYAHSLKYGLNFSRLKYVLVTHSHMDHFYAHDFILHGYKYASLIEPKLEIFGNEEVEKVYNECCAREMKPEVDGTLKFTEIKPYSDFKFGDFRVIAIPANHSKQEEALLFYIEHGGKGYLHLYDTGRVGDKAISFLAEKGVKANLVCFDCTFIEHIGGENSRHMGIADDMLIKDKLLEKKIIDENTKLVISHFSHNSNPTRAHLKEIEKKYGVTAAYDGYTAEI